MKALLLFTVLLCSNALASPVVLSSKKPSASTEPTNIHDIPQDILNQGSLVDLLFTEPSALVSPSGVKIFHARRIAHCDITPNRLLRLPYTRTNIHDIPKDILNQGILARTGSTAKRNFMVTNKRNFDMVMTVDEFLKICQAHGSTTASRLFARRLNKSSRPFVLGKAVEEKNGQAVSVILYWHSFKREVYLEIFDLKEYSGKLYIFDFLSLNEKYIFVKGAHKQETVYVIIQAVKPAEHRRREGLSPALRCGTHESKYGDQITVFYAMDSGAEPVNFASVHDYGHGLVGFQFDDYQDFFAKRGYTYK